MGRKKVLCPHGVLGVANCKICQREQHTARVRELRQKKRELEEQEHALEKEYNQQNTMIYIHSVPTGKATGVSDLKNPERPAPTAKHIQENTSPKIRSCGACVFQEYCDVYRRLSALKRQCPGFTPREGTT